MKENEKKGNKRLRAFLATKFDTKAIRKARRLSKGYNSEQCKKDLERLGDSIINPINPNRIRSLEKQLEKMERSYYFYRIGNLKYNKSLDRYKKGASSHVLTTLRDKLSEIVLDASVNRKIKKEAISILFAQQSSSHLYLIARDERSIGQFIDDDNGNEVTVAYYIIQNFPNNSDHDLINLAFCWANRSNQVLTLKAIEKITSPKSLLTLCLFFHDNRNNSQYVKAIIDQLGNIIEKNMNWLKENNYDIDFEHVDCEHEQNWLEPHAKSMLYSAHMALSKIVVVFADENTFESGNTALLIEEQELVKKAIDKMTIPGFLQRIIHSNKDGFKSAKCEIRRNQLTHFKLTAAVARERLIRGVCTDREMIEAINLLDFTEEENRGVAHTLAERLQKNVDNIQYTPKLKDTVGYEFCKKYYGDHEFIPLDDKGGRYIEKCEHCGLQRYAHEAYFSSLANGVLAQLPAGDQKYSDDSLNYNDVDQN